MRTKSNILLLVLAMSLTGMFIACKKDSAPTTTTSNVNLKKGLLVYLPFDGNFADSSGNSNVTTARYGATLTYDEHGYANSALNGTANGEKVSVANNGSIKFDTAISISVNVMLRAFGTNDFISFMDNSSSKAFVFGMGTGAPGLTNFGYGFGDSLATCSTWGTVEYQSSDTTGFIPQPESWYNYVVTFERGTMKCYVNGSLVSTRTAKSTYVPIPDCATLNVGGWWDGDAGAGLNGKLDEFRLYNRVLNADEIAELAKDFQPID